MLLKIFLFIFISISLYSQTILNDTYFVDKDKIYLSDLLPNTAKDELLYTINEYKHSKRVKTKDLMILLKKLGVKDVKISSRYIKFQLRSPIDTSPIEDFVVKYYKERYPNMKIYAIKLHSRGFVESIPKEYFIQIRDKNFLSSDGIVNIKSTDGKKIFFNYFINAEIKVLVAKEKIKRLNKLSLFNTHYKSIKFDRFKAAPLTKLEKNKYQTSRHIKINEAITLRDVEKLDLVHKNTQVSVSLYDDGIYITFVAKALQSGALGDIITIQKTNLTRLKATVIGNKRVQIK